MILNKVKNYYHSNGLLGISSKKLKDTVIVNIRGGKLDLPSSSLFKKKKSKQEQEIQDKLENLLEDNKISAAEKDPYSSLYEEQYEKVSSFEERQRYWKLKNSNFDNDPSFQKLRESLIAKSEHPVYSQIKSKLPTVIFLPLTANELKRLAAYRILGFTSAPFTVGAYLGISLPCAVTFSMLEMYAPDKLKLPCKIMKWGGGGLYYGVCYTLDHLSKPLEKKAFGDTLEINAQQTMGTLPKLSDMKEIYELSKELMEKKYLK